MPVQAFTAALIMKPDLMPELVRVTDEGVAVQESIARKALYFRMAVYDYSVEATSEGQKYHVISEEGRDESFLRYTCVDRLYTINDVVKELDRALLAYPDGAVLNEADSRTRGRLQKARKNFNELASVTDRFPAEYAPVLIIDPILIDSPPNYTFVNMDNEKVYDSHGRQLWPRTGYVQKPEARYPAAP
jgi:hypothetical protein